MLKKNKDISNSKILLKIDPPNPKAGGYIRIFILVTFAIFSAFMFYTFPQITADTRTIYFGAFSYLILCAVIAAAYIRLKPTSLIFTDKGITDSTFISLYWTELEFYNFGLFKDIGMKEGKRILHLISNKPPLYQFRLVGLPRYFYDRGFVFSETDMKKAEELFEAKRIRKEP